MSWPAQFSFNQLTAGDRPLDELIEGAVQFGVTRLGLQRRQTEAFGFERAVELLKATDIEISSYGSAGGWGRSRDPADAAANRDRNLRILDQAVELGTSVVSVGVGGLAPGDRDVPSARARVEAGLVELAPRAAERQLQLAIEPLHPVFFPDLSVLPTLGLAVDLVERIDLAPVGLNVDSMHVWWDPELVPLLRRAAARVYLVQINDWLPNAPHRLDRGVMGEGCIDFNPMIEALDGYAGIYEIETINDELRKLDLGDVFRRSVVGFQQTFGRAAQTRSYHT
jgi:sugar phosphate isomerase/epimerase